jgi:hypothetical protein
MRKQEQKSISAKLERRKKKKMYMHTIAINTF